MRKNNHIYYIETPLHLFLSILAINKKNHNTLIVDIHRDSQKKLIETTLPYFRELFDEVRFIHNYPQIGVLKKMNLFSFIIYIMKLNRDVSNYLKSSKIFSNTNLNIFTLNRMERILINKLNNITKLTVNIFEDGIGSYTRPEDVLGLDSSNSSFSFVSVIRSVLNLKIEPGIIKSYYLSEPKLIQFDLKTFPIRINKAKFRISNLHKILDNKKEILKISKDLSSIHTVYMLNNINVEEELQFFYKYFQNKSAFIKFHPSSSLKTGHDNIILWELHQLLFEIKYIFSYGSSAGLTLLNMNQGKDTCYVFLFEVYKELGFNWFDSANERLILYKYMEIYPGNIKIPKSIAEFSELINKL
jgi:hypothetical protein